MSYAAFLLILAAGQPTPYMMGWDTSRPQYDLKTENAHVSVDISAPPRVQYGENLELKLTYTNHGNEAVVLENPAMAWGRHRAASLIIFTSQGRQVDDLFVNRPFEGHMGIRYIWFTLPAHKTLEITSNIPIPDVGDVLRCIVRPIYRGGRYQLQIVAHKLLINSVPSEWSRGEYPPPPLPVNENGLSDFGDYIRRDKEWRARIKESGRSKLFRREFQKKWEHWDEELFRSNVIEITVTAEPVIAPKP